MAEFEINVDEQAFRTVGVEVGFDEEAYTQLLEELQGTASYAELNNSSLPLAVNISLSGLWGHSVWRKAFAVHGNDVELPYAQYRRGTNAINIKTDDNVA